MFKWFKDMKERKRIKTWNEEFGWIRHLKRNQQERCLDDNLYQTAGKVRWEQIESMTHHELLMHIAFDLWVLNKKKEG